MRATFAFTYTTFLSGIIILVLGCISCSKIHFDPLPVPQVVLPTPPNLTGQPNIILILADDIGYEVPTFDGGQSYSTPNLDMMAANGVRFTNCFATPFSSPSRFMLTTGKYNFRNYTNWGVMNPSEVTVATMLRNAGYATCVSGKWQFDGGDASIKALGFDKYCVWDAFKTGVEEEAEFGSSYKDPTVYQNGAYLPADQTTGKYGVDIFNQYVLNFIDSNKTHPFFIYYPIPIAHAPFTPTPDDARYATWNSTTGKSDTAYYPSMVHYMDKMIDSVITKVQAEGLEKNTVILFTSDNGTPNNIASTFNGQRIRGGMGIPNVYGTHVPMLAYCPGSVTPGVCNSFIDFTDFLPTIIGLANTKLSSAYGKTDGVSFRNQLFEPSLANRNFLFEYVYPHPESPSLQEREYVQDTAYKLYTNGYGFFNIQKDPTETTKLVDSILTKDEKIKVFTFRAILDSIHP